jgi:hypothetical protein
VSNTSPTFKSKYILNTNQLSFSQAELFCNENGGHIVSWEVRPRAKLQSCGSAGCRNAMVAAA